MNNTFWLISEIFWLACGVATIIAAARAPRSRSALYAGRAAVGALFIIGGALVHVINLASGANYRTFADPALFGWVTSTWHSVLVPNHLLLIGLLALFEATVGVLALSGGRRTQLGYVGVIAFYLLLWLFGWIEVVWCLVMVPPMLLLLRAERRAAAAGTPGAAGAAGQGAVAADEHTGEAAAGPADSAKASSRV